jgi:hypothetical protein
METAQAWLSENWQWALAFALLYLSLWSLGLKVRAIARRHLMLERAVFGLAEADGPGALRKARREAAALKQVVQDADS